jgi:SAM-dependent methyltransferase
MNIPNYGRLKAISQQRIKSSRQCEVSWWEAAQGIPVRNEQQLVAFDNFTALPNDLGDVLELGAGPYTKVRLILEQEELRTVKSIALVDPLIEEYLSNTDITTSFTHEELCVERNCFPTKLHSTSAEAFFSEQHYDTIILVNTLEHTENAVQILHNIWVLLKPGGLLVFGEEYSTSFQLQIVDPCHPIRIMRVLFDEYLDLFGEQLLGPRTGMDIPGITHEGVKQSVYAILRK